MKRKILCGFALCVALSVTGCGKDSKEQQAVNYYQNELGLDKEDAEELAHEIYGDDEEDTDTYEEESGEVSVEALPELINSEWYEEKVQIYDMIFSNDWYMTEEDIRAAAEGSSYDVELPEEFDQNGNIILRDIVIDGKTVAQVWIDSRGYDLIWNKEEDMLLYGLIDAGEYYSISYGSVFMGDNWYDKASTEFVDLETRDDVLAYLSDNGFVEVEEAQATYARVFKNSSSEGINPLKTPVEYAYTPHYYSKGVQSVTFYRMLKLSETDQVIEELPYIYDGADLNLVNCVSFEFDTNGTIKSISSTIMRVIVYK